MHTSLPRRITPLYALLIGLVMTACGGDAGYPLIEGGSYNFKNSQGHRPTQRFSTTDRQVPLTVNTQLGWVREIVL